MDTGGARYIRSPSSVSDRSSQRVQPPYSSSPLSQAAMTGEESSCDEDAPGIAVLRRGSEHPGGPLDVSPKTSSKVGNPSHAFAHTGRKRSYSTSPTAAPRAHFDSLDFHLGSESIYGSSSRNAASSSQSAFLSAGDQPTETPSSPSSAPATPSLLALTHPSPFIHTHHPKRSSPTPLSLNLISPVGPLLASAGTSPPASLFNDRRSSAASSRRDYHTASGPRRSSLTPSMSALAAANTTKAYAYASPADPTTPTTAAPRMHARTRTDDSLGSGRLPSSQPLLQELAALHMQGRRGSMPHIGGSTSTRFLPSLPPQRPSVGDEGAMEGLSGFRFGSGSGPAEKPTDATISGAASVNPVATHSTDDVFEQAEAVEAERQRKAFIDATFGADGRRARERLSIGGASSVSNLRRESLQLWNHFGSTASLSPALPEQEMLGAGPAEMGGRRGSLPVAIPWNGNARLTKKEQKRRDLEDKPFDEDVKPASFEDEEEVVEAEEAGLDQSHGADTQNTGQEAEDDDEEEEPSYLHTFQGQALPPLRPLPPLLPLSDPGPRLLPSTLALHRANHLLTARHLEAEPLPHPLPPSLHPPAPVDLAEFDIDFILAGSQTQLGRDKRKSSRSSRRLSGKHPDAAPGNYPPTPTLQLGKAGEEEDTFAKFVGQFDDEYGGRRGEWTFRACPPSAPSQGASQEPAVAAFSAPFAALIVPKAEWDSRGAGRYELYSTGEVASTNTGRTWRVRKTGTREYELERVSDWSGRSTALPGLAHRDTSSSTGSSEFSTDFHLAPTCTADGTTYVLAAKLIHREQGGVKALNAQRKSSGASTPRSSRSGSRMQSSFSRSRFGSDDSASTAKAVARSLPVDRLAPNEPTDLASSHSRRPSVVSKSRPSDPQASPVSRGLDPLDRVDDLPPLLKSSEPKERRHKYKDSESHDGAKKERSIGSVIKRGWLASINRSQADQDKKDRREEKERERMQSHSWSGASSSSDTWSNYGESSSSAAVPFNNARRDTEAWTRDLLLASSPRASADVVRSIGIEEEQNGGLPWQEGKAWADVPEEALAMVIPLEGCPCVTGSAGASAEKAEADVKQALLVYFVPFNSLRESENVHHPTPLNGQPAPATSTSHRLLHGAKLLRRKGSREKDAMLREHRGSDPGSGPSVSLQGQPAGNFILHPLPFRSFRLVARVVNMADLRSEPTTSNWAGFKSSRDSPFVDTPASTPPNGAAEQSVPAGRNFPTVIAVCHSRSQGVEFVLEGLDRLGFCEGQSAWGPTGYEEWRGSGLSEEGREVLDLLWAGCVGVMGLASV